MYDTLVENIWNDDEFKDYIEECFIYNGKLIKKEDFDTVFDFNQKKEVFKFKNIFFDMDYGEKNITKYYKVNKEKTKQIRDAIDNGHEYVKESQYLMAEDFDTDDIYYLEEA